MHRAQSLALCLSLLLVPSAGARAQGGPIDPAELQAFLDKEIGSYLAKAKVPGAVVSVVQDGRVLLAKGYGWADAQRKIPVSPESTLFPVGSLSKPVTATAVLQLAERGRLRLDDDVNRYLTGFQLRGGPGLGRPLFVSALFLRPGIGRITLTEIPAEPPVPARRAFRLGTLVAGLDLLFLFGMFLAFRQAAGSAGLQYGVPALMKGALGLGVAASLLALALPVHALRAWRQGWWSLPWRAYYSLVTLGALGFVAFLAEWNLLGFRY